MACPLLRPRSATRYVELKIAHRSNSAQLPDGSRGRVVLQWEGTAYRGIACDMTSAGFKALSEATRAVLGECKPYAETGALVGVTCHFAPTT